MENIIGWKDKQLVLHEFKKSHANGGRLSKYWVEDINSGKQYLIKSSSLFGFEPFSEKIAYIIGKDIGIDVLEYDILPSKLFKGYISTAFRCKYVSICEKIDRKKYSITSIGEIKRAINTLNGPNSKIVTNKEVMYALLDDKYIDTMILFDAIIGNRDRHYGNVHLLRNRKGEIIGAPILDNGNSILATRALITIYALGYNVGEWFNESCTMSRNHDKQVSTICSLNNIEYNITSKTVQILNDIEPVLELMPRIRAKVIRKFLIYRIHKYLTLIKNDVTDEIEIRKKLKKFK